MDHAQTSDTPRPKTVLQWLCAQHPEAARTTLRRMVRQGRVTLDGRTVRSVNEPVGATGRPQVLPSVPRPGPSLAPLVLVHEDEDVLVVAKPAGLLTSTVARERRPTAIAIVRAYVKAADARARPGVIHRLDRDASGLLVFSKNARAFDHLKRQFFHHTVYLFASADILFRLVDF